MPRVARLGDTSDHGAANITELSTEPTVYVNGVPIAIFGPVGPAVAGTAPCALCSPSHPIGCSIPGPVEGSPNIFAGVQAYPIHRYNDARGCGAETNFASPDVYANDPRQIRVQGGTVAGPLASPAAPISFKYPHSLVMMFTGDDNFYIFKENFSWSDLLSLDVLDSVGKVLIPEIKFQEDLDPIFEVPDLDFAVKTNIGENDAMSQVVLGGIEVGGFPSYGNYPIEDLGKIQGTPTVENFTSFFNFQLGTAPTLKQGIGTNFTIANESGTVSGSLTLIVFPGLDTLIDYILGNILPPGIGI